MYKSIFEVKQMDCPSEENLIRMKLDGIQEIADLVFDIPNRKLTIYHTGSITQISSALDELNLGSKKTETVLTSDFIKSDDDQQKQLLRIVLAINFSFFIIEMTTGLISDSMGLVADSLDMLADALVYGISLYAVGSSIKRKTQVARLAGYFQITLAIIGISEVIRRFIGNIESPDYTMMIYISLLALAANATCLFLLQKSKSKEAHMRASMIFTSNDIVINLGVVVAALLVNWLNTPLPDLIIGLIVFVIVLRGAIRILKLGK